MTSRSLGAKIWLNGRKMPKPMGIYNARQGGRSGRLWKLPPDDTAALKKALAKFDRIFLPKGVYKLSDTLRLGPSAVLWRRRRRHLPQAVGG